MKRALTLTLTMALVGSLMFMGFAGTAAAQNVSFDGIDIDQESGDATNLAEVNQANNNAQVGVSSALAVSDGGDAGHEHHHKADKYGGDDGGAAAASSVDQVQVVDQSNAADVDQTAVTGDNEVEFEVEIEGFLDE